MSLYMWKPPRDDISDVTLNLDKFYSNFPSESMEMGNVPPPQSQYLLNFGSVLNNYNCINDRNYVSACESVELCNNIALNSLNTRSSVKTLSNFSKLTSNVVASDVANCPVRSYSNINLNNPELFSDKLMNNSSDIQNTTDSSIKSLVQNGKSVNFFNSDISKVLSSYKSKHVPYGVPSSYLNNWIHPWSSHTQMQYMVFPNDFVFSKRMKCGSCNIILNSKSQAIQHFQGRSHLKKLKSKGVKLPAELEEKLRSIPKINKPVTSSWNHGPAYTNQTDPVRKAVYENMVGALPKKRKRDVKQIPCNVCGVTFNSQVQYLSHIEGSKHKRKVEGKIEEKNNAIEEAKSETGDKHKSKVTNKEEAGNLEGQVSGMYFCRNCNVSVPTAGKLAEHIKTPEHIAITDEKNIQGKNTEKPMETDSF